MDALELVAPVFADPSDLALRSVVAGLERRTSVRAGARRYDLERWRGVDYRRRFETQITIGDEPRTFVGLHRGDR